MNVCLASLTGAHYRELIYKLIDARFHTTFLFGKGNEDVRQLNFNSLTHVVRQPLKYLIKRKIYRIEKIFKTTLNSDVVIDDMGILCLDSWINLVLCRLHSIPVFLWTHGCYGREGRLKLLLKRIYSALASGTMVYGYYARNLMISSNFNPHKIVVIHNSLDYDTQLTIRKSLSPSRIYSQHFGNSCHTLIFIGRLTHIKKLHLLLEALQLLKERGYNLNLVIIGEGEVKQELETLAHTLKVIENVWFYGASYDERQNAELIYNADLCIAPGNIGLTAIHSMMFGCPCMSHDDYPNQMPEFESIISGRTGDFFKRNDAMSIASKIRNWFDDPHYDRQHIRKNCFDEIDSNWNPHRQIEIISQFISKRK